MPTDEGMVEEFRGLFDRYGMWVALVGSFLEVLLLIGWYFPGSVLIFLSVILAKTWFDVFLAVTAVTIGMQAGYLTNYLLGKYGWYRLLLRFGLKQSIDEAQVKIKKYGIRFALFTYWHPGLGSVSATALGVLQTPFVSFFTMSLLAVLFWNVFWGIVVHEVGERSFSLFFSWPFIVSVMLVWTLIRFVSLLKEEKDSTK
jgi:membrane protein DedA with SNARE-associated domain